MTGTYTQTNTFTRTHAEYLASKIAADLLQMQHFYGNPSDSEIDKYLQELIILLLGGYLDSVDYGYRKDNKWVVVVRYSAQFGSSSTTDDRSGGVYPGADITGSTWGSYLRKNSKYNNLPLPEKTRIEELLPIPRSAQDEPGYQAGSWTSEKSYQNGDASLDRKIFRPL